MTKYSMFLVLPMNNTTTSRHLSCQLIINRQFNTTFDDGLLVVQPPFIIQLLYFFSNHYIIWLLLDLTHCIWRSLLKWISFLKHSYIPGPGRPRYFISLMLLLLLMISLNGERESVRCETVSSPWHVATGLSSLDRIWVLFKNLGQAIGCRSW